MRTQPPAVQDPVLKTRNSLARDPATAVPAAATVKFFWIITVGLYISLLCINQLLTQKFKKFQLLTQKFKKFQLLTQKFKSFNYLHKSLKSFNYIHTSLKGSI